MKYKITTFLGTRIYSLVIDAPDEIFAKNTFRLLAAEGLGGLPIMGGTAIPLTIKRVPEDTKHDFTVVDSPNHLVVGPITIRYLKVQPKAKRR